MNNNKTRFELQIVKKNIQQLTETMKLFMWPLKGASYKKS